jgi:hypothetical protein
MLLLLLFDEGYTIIARMVAAITMMMMVGVTMTKRLNEQVAVTFAGPSYFTFI